MDTGTVVGIVAIALEGVALLIGGVWCVSKIQATTRVLGNDINNLSHTIDSLAAAVERVDEKTETHGVRLSVIETKQSASG